ncbi:MAG: hypothetical protein R3272_12900 [Candidatus Promineifilaceae bacterium]|nr:hypothetical protein [Candidatus Promineifilaceae bacterium]
MADVAGGSRRSWHYTLLWLLMIASLGINAVLVAGLLRFRAQARQEVAAAAVLVESVELEDVILPVHVDETLVFSTTIPFEDTFRVPINASIPVNTEILFDETITVPIETTIPVDTRVQVRVPVLGNVTIPIVADIPVDLDVDVPIERDIPVQLDIPVDLVVEVPVESNVPVRAAVPVEIEVPVAVPLDEMGLNLVFDQLAEALDGLGRLFGPVEE